MTQTQLASPKIRIQIKLAPEKKNKQKNTPRGFCKNTSSPIPGCSQSLATDAKSSQNKRAPTHNHTSMFVAIVRNSSADRPLSEENLKATANFASITAHKCEHVLKTISREDTVFQSTVSDAIERKTHLAAETHAWQEMTDPDPYIMGLHGTSWNSYQSPKIKRENKTIFLNRNRSHNY